EAGLELRQDLVQGLLDETKHEPQAFDLPRALHAARGAEVLRARHEGEPAEAGGDPLPRRGRQAALVEPDGAAANGKGVEKGGERVGRARRVSFHEGVDAPYDGVSAVVGQRGGGGGASGEISGRPLPARRGGV